MAYFRSNTRSHHSARRTRRRGTRSGSGTPGLLLGVTSALALAAAGVFVAVGDDVIAAGEPFQSAAFDCRTTPADVLFIGSLATSVPEQAAVVDAWLAGDIAGTPDGTVRQVAHRSAAGTLHVSDRICFEQFREGVFGPTDKRKRALRSADREAVTEASAAATASVSRDPGDSRPFLPRIAELLRALETSGQDAKRLTIVTAASGLGAAGSYDEEPDVALRLLVVEPQSGLWRPGEAEAMEAWARKHGHEIELLPAPPAPDVEGCLPEAERFVALIDTTDPIPEAEVSRVIEDLARFWDRAEAHRLRVELRLIGGTVAESERVFSACRGANDTGAEIAETAWETLEAHEAGSGSPWSSKNSAITATVLDAVAAAPDGIAVFSDFLFNDAAVSLKDNATLHADRYAATHAERTGVSIPADGVLGAIGGTCTYLASATRSHLQSRAHRTAVAAIFGCAIPRN